MRRLAVQFSDKLLNPVNRGREYYRRVYPRVPHLWDAGPDYMELPAWVARLAGIVPELEYRVVRSREELAQLARCLGPLDTVFFSILDNTAEYVGEFARGTRARVKAGGYVGKQQVPEGAEWFDRMEDLSQRHLLPDRGWDWSIFSGARCVFRVQLSRGCRHGCTFCTIPRGVTAVPWDEVVRSLNGSESLEFERVYLDDKTYGQADPECQMLGRLARELMYRRGSRPLFTVQTTAAQICGGGKPFQGGMWRHGVDTVEIGLEILNDKILHKLRKPHTVQMVKDAVRALSEWGIRVIPYVLLGLPGCGREEYTGTLEWLRGAYGSGWVPFVHVNWLAPTKGAKGLSELPQVEGLNQNGGGRPWLTARQQAEQEDVQREIERITQAEGVAANG